jgi:RNA polymerase sigma-70 factor (ECF subfamily)
MIHTDLQLLERIQQADKAAFDQLYLRYWKVLYELAVRKTGQYEEAEDIVQELFIDLWSRKAPISLTTSLRTYLISCLYLKVFKYFRARGFREKHYQDFSDFLQRSGQTAVGIILPDAGFEMQYIRLQEIIDQTVQLMPERMRHVFVMRHQHGYSSAEIAEKLHISTESVKTHLKLAMNRLRKAGEDAPAGITLLPVILWMAESKY